MEQWRPIVGFEGRYEVSDQGRVRSLDIMTRDGRRVRGKLRVPSTDRIGRKAITLKINGNQFPFRVHTLVLTAFVGHRPAGKECAHDNGNASDNRLSNLAWKTHVENNADKVRHGTQWHGETAPGAKLSSADIPRVFDLRVCGLSHRKIGAYLDIAESTIRGILNGKRWGKTVQSLER